MKNNNVPRFSVIVPLYNKRAFIRRAIDSVLAQTFSDFELLVVDDGSTDGSTQVIEDILDPRLKVIRQENQGVGPARNAGMQGSSGQMIAFLDADDAWLSCHLEELQRLADAFPGAGLFSTAHVQVAGCYIPDISIPKSTPEAGEIDYFREAGRKISVVCSSSAAIRRDVFLGLGGFIDRQAGEDLEYWARVALLFPVVVSERVTSLYFRDTDGVMRQLELIQNPRDMDNPPVSTLRDVSPSIAMLCDRAEKDPSLWSNSSIRAYVNGRLSGIPGAIYRGDLVAARCAMRLMLPPLNIKQKFYHYVLKMPDWVLHLVASSYRTLKYVSRRLIARR